MAKPPKPYRISGTDLVILDLYTPSTATGPGGFQYDAGVLSHLDVPCNLAEMSASKAYRMGVNTADKNYDLYMPTHTPGGVALVITLGWRFLDEDGNRYQPINESIGLDDGRQRLGVRRVRS